MKGVYEKLNVLEEIAEKAQKALNEVWPAAGGLIFHNYEIQFYEDDDGRRVGIKINFDEDFDITPNIDFFERVRKATGAEDIYLNVEDGIVTKIELFFKEGDK